MSKLENKSKSWVFTLNNPTKEDDVFYTSWASHAQYYLYKLEKGDNGTVHHQGYVVWKNRKTLATVKNLLPRAHWEVRRGTHTEAVDYCMKQETMIGLPIIYGDDSAIPKGKGQRTDLIKLQTMIQEGASLLDVADEHFSEFMKYGKNIREYQELFTSNKKRKLLDTDWKKMIPRLWQSQIISLLEKQNDRVVLWVVDETGGKGKTTLAKMLISTKGAFYVTNGKTADVGYAYDGQEYVVLDYTRDYENYVNYSIIEQMKNGILFTSKYQSKTKVFKPAKVVVFSNFQPDKTKLSSDRWKIIDLAETKL